MAPRPAGSEAPRAVPAAEPRQTCGNGRWTRRHRVMMESEPDAMLDRGVTDVAGGTAADRGVAGRPAVLGPRGLGRGGGGGPEGDTPPALPRGGAGGGRRGGAGGGRRG